MKRLSRIACLVILTFQFACVGEFDETSPGYYAYVANRISNSVTIYRNDRDTGTLSKLSEIQVGDDPVAVVGAPSGKFFYVIQRGSRSVAVYSVEPVTGNLSLRKEIVLGYVPTTVELHPTGRFAYITNHGSDRVSIYKFEDTYGDLVKVTDAATGSSPTTIAFSPDGKFAYIVSAGTLTTTNYTVNTTSGELRVGSTVQIGEFPAALAVHPNGKFAYISDSSRGSADNPENRQSGSAMFALKIDPGDGALRVGNRLPTGGIGAATVKVHPSGRWVYTINTSTNSIAWFDVNQEWGDISEIRTSATQFSPSSITFDATGKFAYVTNMRSKSVSIYDINQSTGAPHNGAGKLEPRVSIEAGDGPFDLRFLTVPPP